MQWSLILRCVDPKRQLKLRIAFVIFGLTDFKYETFDDVEECYQLIYDALTNLTF